MDKNQTNETVELDLKELFVVLWAKKWLILIVGIAVCLLVTAYSMFFVTKKYDASCQIFMTATNDASLSDIQKITQLVKDAKVIIKTRDVMQDVVNTHGLNHTADELINMISIDVTSDTRIMKITCRSESASESKIIADAVSQKAKDYLPTVMDVAYVNVVETAVAPSAPVTPNVKRNAVIGLAVGLAVAIFGVLIVYLVDDTIKTSDDVEKYLGVSVLGLIPITKKLHRNTSTSQSKMGAK